MDAAVREKQLKYASLVANTIMLSNIVDMTAVLSSMARGRTRSHARPGRLRQPLSRTERLRVERWRRIAHVESVLAEAQNVPTDVRLSRFIAPRTPSKQQPR